MICCPRTKLVRHYVSCNNTSSRLVDLGWLLGTCTFLFIFRTQVLLLPLFYHAICAGCLHTLSFAHIHKEVYVRVYMYEVTRVYEVNLP